MKTVDLLRSNVYSFRLPMGFCYISKKSKGEEKHIIEGFVSMKDSERDYDIIPPEAFKIDTYMQNPQVWYNHGLWKDENGNEIPVGRTLFLTIARLEKIPEDESLAVIDTLDEKETVLGFITKERAEALNLSEKDVGLWARCKITVDEVWELIEKGELNAFSWQGKVKVREEVRERDGEPKIVMVAEEIDLFEISVVFVPANEKALFTVAKSLFSKDNSLISQTAKEKKEKYECECIECGYREVTDKHCKDIKCKKCGGQMRRVGRPGPGQKSFMCLLDESEGHIHVAEVFLTEDNTLVGKTLITRGNVDQHEHSINCSIDMAVTNVSSTGTEHFHKIDVTNVKKYLDSQQANMSKSIVPFQDFPLAPMDMRWSFTTADQNALLGKGEKKDWATYRRVHIYYNPEKANTKAGYKLPIAKKINGRIKAVPRGVMAAMGALLGARGGVDIPSNEKKKAYNHLVKYYKKMDKKPPEFKQMSYYSFVRHLKSNLDIDDKEIEELIGKSVEWTVAKSQNVKKEDKAVNRLSQIKELTTDSPLRIADEAKYGDFLDAMDDDEYARHLELLNELVGQEEKYVITVSEKGEDVELSIVKESEYTDQQTTDSTNSQDDSDSTAKSDGDTSTGKDKVNLDELLKKLKEEIVKELKEELKSSQNTDTDIKGKEDDKLTIEDVKQLLADKLEEVMSGKVQSSTVELKNLEKAIEKFTQAVDKLGSMKISAKGISHLNLDRDYDKLDEETFWDGVFPENLTGGDIMY